ncbi:MAG: metal-dependent hydrolase [Candidatus Heimdallarchaeota archaeon]|nr:MAG: metal-dependent hydrolase [Candidatus Heimdallarchaeota archaeon]
MKGLTHVFFGVGFVSLILSFFEVHFLLWIVGTLVLSPVFSRLPDQDQKISRITFNRIVPHRGKGTHNLIYGLPLLACFFLVDWPFFGPIIIMILGSIFGALFAHSFVDAFNYGGVWLGIFKVKGFLEWNSVFGNFAFKFVGVLLFLLSLSILLI